MAMRKYRVRPGETLASIAEDYYGDQNMYAYIYQHNRFYIQDPNTLAIGQEIVIPHLPISKMFEDALVEMTDGV